MGVERVDLTDPQAEIEELRRRVGELSETMEAVVAGGIDAVVMSDGDGVRIYTLAGTEEPYRLLVDNMSEGAITVSERGTVLFVNRQLATLLGRDKEQLVGTSAEDLVVEEDRAALADLLSPAPAPGRGVEVTLDASPTPIPVNLSAAELQSEGLTVTSMIATDLRKQRRAAAILEEQVEERTRDLVATNAELALAYRELEAFAYSVAHHLRTPLRAIDGFSHVLEEDCSGDLDERSLGMLARIRAASEHMDKLISALLTLARVGRAAVRWAPVDLSALATEVAGGLEHADPGRSASISIQPGLAVIGDRRLLREVLANLMSNSWKATEAGKPVEVEFGAEEGETGSTYFVRDHGRGFDMRDAGRLFEPFQSVGGGGSARGTEIGLAVVKRIVNRHGGEVRAMAKPGEGATFFFTIGPPPPRALAHA